MHILAGWRPQASGSMTIAVTDSSSFTSTIPDGSYSHLTLEFVLGFGNYVSFATALQNQLNQDGAGGYSVTFNPDMTYTISRAAGFSMSFVGDSGLRMAGALGFALPSYATATSRTSDMTPHFVIETASGCRSRDSRPYEPDDVVLGGHTLGGAHFGIASSSPIKFWDFDVMFESLAKTHADEAPNGTTVGDVSFTYEHLWEHVRSAEPFLLWDGSAKNPVMYLRPKGASYSQAARRRESPDYDDYWHIRFETFFKGYL